MAALPIAILAALVVLGAGLVPGTAPPLAVGLLLAACIRPLPSQPAFRAGLWALVALVAWALLTTLPAGPTAGAWRAAQWSDIQGFVSRHGACLPGLSSRAPVPRLSLHAGGTWRWLLLVSGAGGMFCLVAASGSRSRLLLAKLLVILGALVAAAGLAGRFLLPRPGFLMGWYPVADIGGGDPFGPFVNRNHFAAFCALLTPLALTLALAPAAPPYDTDPHDDGPPDGRHLGLSPAQRLLFGACLLALVAGVLASRSRGGTAAIVVGLATVVLFWLRRGPAAAAWACLAGLGGILLVALWPDAAFQGRLHDLRDTATALGARWPVWGDCLRLWSRVPFLGCGANAFGMVFPQVTQWATVQQATHAESDVLQVLAEGGLLGALLLAATLGFWCLPLLQVLFGRRHPASRSLPYPLLAGVAGALAAVAFQSCVDIPLRIPLCAWTVAAVAGLAAPRVSRHHRRHHRHHGASPDPDGSDALSRSASGRRVSLAGLATHLALVALLALALVATWQTPGWRALYRDRDAWLAEAPPQDIAALLGETPTYWQAWCELGERLCLEAGRASPADGEALAAAGWDALRAAQRCNPRDPRLCSLLATSLWRAGQWTEARPYRDAQLALDPADHAARLHWLQAEWQAGFTDECNRLAYRFAAADGPPDPAGQDGLLWLADRELAEGSVTRARDALLAVLPQRPADPTVLRLLARCEARLGAPDRETEWLRRLTATGAADAASWWRLAELALARRDRTALLEALGRAVQLDPSRRRRADEIWKDFVQSLNPVPAAPPAAPMP